MIHVEMMKRMGNQYVPFVRNDEGKLVQTTWASLELEARARAERELLKHVGMIDGTTIH